MIVRTSCDADKDIEKVWFHFETERPGKGDLFHADVLDTIGYILQYPGGFQLRYRHFRFAPLAVFRYYIIYSIEDEAIVIHRIRHMHQRPMKRYFGR